MTITLHHIDPTRNRRRFYTLQLAPNLFSAWSLIRSWGHIGTAGRQRTSWHDTREAAEQACDRLLQAKQRRRYGCSALEAASSLSGASDASVDRLREGRRAKMMNASSVAKMAEVSRPMPTAMPTEAVSQSPAAVVRP